MFGFKTKKEIGKLWESICKLTHFEKKIEHAVPVFNKTIEKVKKLEELYAGLMQVMEKMDEKLDEYDTKIEKMNIETVKAKGTK